MIIHYCNLPESYTLCGIDFPCSYVATWRPVTCKSCRKNRIFKSKDINLKKAGQKEWREKHKKKRALQKARYNRENYKMKIHHGVKKKKPLISLKHSHVKWSGIDNSLDKTFGKSKREKYVPYKP